MQTPQPQSELDWHIDAIARSLAEQDPHIQHTRDEIRAKVAQAVQACTGAGQRQNRSSADKYALPPIAVDTNPLGIQKKGKR